MRIDRKELENELRKIIIEYSFDKKVQQKIVKYFEEKNVLPGEILAILGGNIPLETISQVMLGALADAFYKVLRLEIINPERYFNEGEIKIIKEFKRNIKGMEKYPITFEDVLKVAEDHYITYAKAQDVVELYNKNIVIYNYKTQRNSKLIEYKDKIIMQPNINWNSVKEMTEDMIKDRFITNFITLNLLQNGEDEFEYDEKNKTLTIYAGEINVLDGFHRSLAMINAIQQKPNLSYVTGVNITNFDVDKAIRFIIQEDKKNKINKRYLQSINPDKLANGVVQKLNESAMSDLKGKITNDITLIQQNKALTLTNIMADAIEYHYKLKTRKDVYQTAKWLIEFFDELIGCYPDEFIENIAETKKNSVINHKNIFIGYIALSKELQNADNWREKLYEVMLKIDFNKNNKIWEEIDLFRYEIKKRTIKKISNYFVSLLQEGSEINV